MRILNRLSFTLLLVAGCAHVPPFTPSQPLAQAKSLQEGLVLCNEYRLPPESKRPVTLRPFLSCLDDLQEQFPAAAAGHGVFGPFRDEFRLLYGTLNGENWSERLGTELDIAVHTILRGLWQQDAPVITPLERELALKNFPTTSKRLGVAGWTVSTRATFDPGLEMLKAGFAALSLGDQRNEDRTGAVSAAASSQVAELCGRYLHLRAEIQYLNLLWRDQYDFTQLAPQNPISASVRQKYLNRFRGAVRELEELRPEITVARANGSFRVLACHP